MFIVSISRPDDGLERREILVGDPALSKISRRERFTLSTGVVKSEEVVVESEFLVGGVLEEDKVEASFFDMTKIDLFKIMILNLLISKNITATLIFKV
jgi:hypothetical protein